LGRAAAGSATSPAIRSPGPRASTCPSRTSTSGS